MVVVRGFHPHPGLPPSRGKGVFGLCLVGVSSPSWSSAVEGGGRFWCRDGGCEGISPPSWPSPVEGEGSYASFLLLLSARGWVCFCGNDNVKTSPPSWPSPVEGEGSFGLCLAFCRRGGGTTCAHPNCR